MAFWYFSRFYRTCYHGLTYALPYMLPYFYGNFAQFLLVTMVCTFPGILLNVVQYIFSKISTQLSIFQRVTTCNHKMLIYFLLKKFDGYHGNALKIIKIFTYFTESKACSSRFSIELKIVVRWKRYRTPPIKVW